MKIGTDIAKISRFEKLTENEIPKKIFSKKEVEYILTKKNRAETAAGIFAAKEAFLKAIGAGISTITLNEISIEHSSSGSPKIILCKKAQDFFGNSFFGNTQVSISHDGDYAIAVVCIETDEYFDLYNKAISIYDSSPSGVITPDIVHPNLPKRKKELHKGDCGRIYVSAGSKGLTGAAIMACNSALRCGGGLITLGCPESLNTIFEIALREVMTKPFPDCDGILTADNADAIALEAQKADVCLIGPGLGRSDDITKITKKLFDTENVYAVADADALFAASEDISMLDKHKAQLILTPHIGEFSRLTRLTPEEILADTKAIGTEFAKKYNVTLVLKSHRTIVCSPDGRCLENISGNPGMATGGSGDVLAGAIASFASQGMNPFEASCTGVYIHSLAGDMAAAKLGEYSLTPGDITDFLPYALKFSTGR